MERPFVNFCIGKGKDVIIVLKDNYPSLIEDAQGLFSQMKPEVWHVNDRTIQAWNLEGFAAETIDVPLRVLHAIETYTEKVEKKGRSSSAKSPKAGGGLSAQTVHCRYPLAIG
jgi:hypothetical protein